MMSNYEQSNTPLMNEKLPGIDKLPKIEENNNIIIENNSTYLPPPCAGNTLNPGLMYPHHISPPLTPAVSPSSVLYDSLQFKRKFSVDVGPFSFGTSSMDQDAYRRSSCSAISMEGIQNNTQRCHEDQADYSFLNSNNDIQQTMTVHQQLKTPSSSSSSTTTTTTRRGHHLTAGPITKHKHVCKYPYCKWSFKRYEHLKRHMLVHTGKRPHVCTYPNCGKSFSRSDNFHAHYRTHTRKENMAYQTKRSTKAAKTTNTITTSMVTPDDDTTTTTTTTTTSPSSIPNVTTQHVFDDRANPFFIKQEPQSFDMSSYQDMYHHHHHRPSYPSEETNGFEHHQYMRHFNHSSQQHQQAFTGPTATLHDTSASHLLNHEVQPPPQQHHHHPSFYPTSHAYSPIHFGRDPFGPLPPHHHHHHYPLQNTSTATTNLTTSTRRPSTRRRSNGMDSNQAKTHVCPVTQCQQRFKRLEHLKRHMRIHTQERPFSCPSCQKAFSRSDNLSQHMKTHQRRNMKKDATNLPPLTSNNSTLMTNMSWHSTTVGC